MSFVGESGSGHSIVLDGAEQHGGRNLGIRPMETVLIGLGSCSAFDVVLMLKKGRQRVTDCEVEIEAERADSVPAVFTRIHLAYKISGKELSEKKVQRAVSLSVEKYCSVSKMLEQSVEISHSTQIMDDEVSES